MSEPDTLNTSGENPAINGIYTLEESNLTYYLNFKTISDRRIRNMTVVDSSSFIGANSKQDLSPNKNRKTRSQVKS